MVRSQLGPPGAEHDEHRAFGADVAAISNAFGDPTRRAAWLFARDAAEAGVTAAEVAEHLGLHPNVARHHLDKLATSTYLEVFVERASARAAGRPAKRYRVPVDVAAAASAGTTGFPARRDDLIVTLLGRALALLPREQAEAMAEKVGEEHGRMLAASMPGAQAALQSGEPGAEAVRDVRTALHAVADALTAHGFAAHAESRDGLIAVIADNCPFGTTAAQHPVLCAVDRGMVRGLLAGLGVDRTPEQETSRARGDATCVTLV
ncbi:MAG TPA: methanogen output domain 1-containing protein [Acidimicrobiales bacterium]|nr:methanogen output domain 1-containing protein [Acidimicrobiales bacterium]